MRRKTKLIEGEWYHVYNRGVNKAKIFDAPYDYDRFMALIHLSNSSEHFVMREIFEEKMSLKDIYLLPIDNEFVRIGAFCLMPNHFHLLVQQKVPDGITNFMQKLSTAYVMYYNGKERRVGPLFQGRFKSVQIRTDRQLRYLFSYIHLNPVKLKEPLWKKDSVIALKKNIQMALSYPYSSVFAYLGHEDRKNVLVDKKSVPWNFSTKEICTRELVSWFIKGEQEK